MLRLFACCFFFLEFSIVTCQTTVDVNKNAPVGGGVTKYVNIVGGTPFVNTKFSTLVEGSPFFKDQIMRGSIISNDGKEYKNILLRLNLLESRVNYIDEKQTEMIVTTPIKEVILLDTIKNLHYQFVFFKYIETTDKPEEDFYELLQSGKVQLYKQHKKRMIENRPYNSATYEQSIKTDIKYYVLVSGKWIQIRKIKELANQLTDKKTEIEKFISEKKLTKDNEENFKALVVYYNTLSAQQ